MFNQKQPSQKTDRDLDRDGILNSGEYHQVFLLNLMIIIHFLYGTDVNIVKKKILGIPNPTQNLNTYLTQK